VNGKFVIKNVELYEIILATFGEIEFSNILREVAQLELTNYCFSLSEFVNRVRNSEFDSDENRMFVNVISSYISSKIEGAREKPFVSYNRSIVSTQFKDTYLNAKDFDDYIKSHINTN
jgi:hypothetical protein